MGVERRATKEAVALVVQHVLRVESTTSSRRDTTLPDASELWNRDGMQRLLASALQAASPGGISGTKKGRDAALACERDVAKLQNSNSYKRAAN